MQEAVPSPQFLFQYRPLAQSNHLLCGTGQVAIVTGWTPKEAVAKYLQAFEYAAIGNLYSPTRGLSPLLRNLLANPHVRYLVVLDATREDRNAGACQCLLDFLKNGITHGQTETGREAWLVDSPVTGYIDIEIPEASLDRLRETVQCVRVETIVDAVSETQRLARSPLAPWGEPQSFPEPDRPAAIAIPGPRYGHRLEGRTIAETWVKILQRIQTTGTIRPTVYGPWRELIDLMAIVTGEPPDFDFPDYLPVRREFIGDYLAQILDDAPDREGVKYTYGQRLRSHFGQDQIAGVIDKLAADSDSSRAVMSLWDVADRDAKTPPSLNHLRVRIVGGELSLTATLRSNDMFSAWVANAMGLRALQCHIRDAIAERSGDQFTLGPLITVSQSAHIYSDCWEQADRVVASQYPKLCRDRAFGDPSGSFTIRIEDGQILADHLTPGSGEVVNCYCGKSARSLYQQIAADCPVLQVEHALYLGTELQKAEMALLDPRITYQQDRPLRSPASPAPSNFPDCP